MVTCTYLLSCFISKQKSVQFTSKKTACASSQLFSSALLITPLTSTVLHVDISDNDTNLLTMVDKEDASGIVKLNDVPSQGGDDVDRQWKSMCISLASQ